MRQFFALLSFSALFLMGCSSLPRHEHVVGDVRSVGSANVVACLEGRNAQEGQKVEVFESVCKRAAYQKRWAKVARTECVDKKVADAQVLSTQNPHEVILKVLAQANVETGNFIKR
jgi:hypothetical protein